MEQKTYSSECLLNALLAALGFLVVQFATDTFGPGVSPDSINYIAAARSLASGRGYLYYDGLPFTLWPPLLPTILSVGVTLGIDLLQFARFLNALTFGLTIFYIGQVASLVIESRVLRGITTATALASFPLLKMFVMIWAEPLFILLVLAFLNHLARTRAAQSVSPRRVATLGGMAACACLQRYLGIVLVLCGVIFFLCSHRLAWKDRLISIATFTFVSLAPLSLWILRNHALADGMTGSRASSSTNALMSIRDLLMVWTNWFLPYDSAIPVRAVAFALTTGLIAAFLLMNTAQPDREDHGRRAAMIFSGGTFVIAYCIALLIITSTIGTEAISQRYLSPIFPIVLLFTFKAIEEFIFWCKRQGMPSERAGILLIVLPLVLLSQSAITTFQVVSIWRQEGTGDYTHIKWQRSELLGWLAQQPLHGEIYSNAADLIYFKTGLTAHSLPSRGADLATWRGTLATDKKHYAAWFASSFRTYLCTPQEFSSVFQLKPIFLRENEVLFELN